MRWLLLGSTGSRAWEPQQLRLSGSRARAPLPCIMWDRPGPGIEPMSPALQGRFLTTGPPGKSSGSVTSSPNKPIPGLCSHLARLNLISQSKQRESNLVGVLPRLCPSPSPGSHLTQSESQVVRRTASCPLSPTASCILSCSSCSSHKASRLHRQHTKRVPQGLCIGYAFCFAYMSLSQGAFIH